MKLIKVGATLGAFLMLSAATVAPAEKHSAWFMLTANGKQWCAFTNEARAKKAGSGDRFDGSETAWVEYDEHEFVLFVDATQSDDSYTEDSYSFDATGRVKQVVRKGHYSENPFFSVTYVPGADGKLTLTAPSRATERQQLKAQHETYFLEWPLYPSLTKTPFSKLIQTKPVISVTERCIKGPPRQISED
jgi:hypothetical protein